MIKVKVLVEGYAKEIKGGWLASSTTTLIEESGKKIIVDPGINRKLLLKSLEKENLKPQDINIVFLTHYHPDHSFLAAIFEGALLIDGNIVYNSDKETEYQEKIPGTEIKVIQTLGHADEHCSLLVTAKEGKIAIAGDVFWWQDDEEKKVEYKSLLTHKDPFAKDDKALRKSRNKILVIADWIIPGHGKMFKNFQKETKK